MCKQEEQIIFREGTGLPIDHRGVGQDQSREVGEGQESLFRVSRSESEAWYIFNLVDTLTVAAPPLLSSTSSLDRLVPEVCPQGRQ